jgi:hypothetical protein
VIEKPGPPPDSATVCGLLAALSLNESVAASGVATVGVNVTETVHVPFGATCPSVGQVLEVRAKSAAFAPVMVGLPLKVSGALPVFVTVTVIGELGIPTGTTPKRSDSVESVTAGAGADVPVPLKATVCGLPAKSLPATLSVALRAPVAVGAKVIETVQFAPPASIPAPKGHVVPVGAMPKSPAFVPVMVMDVSFSVPVFAATLTVAVCGALVVVTA